jgi:enamine deaminase RidA (YjgF/YER057c/UK114 family)
MRNNHGPTSILFEVCIYTDIKSKDVAVLLATKLKSLTQAADKNHLRFSRTEANLENDTYKIESIVVNDPEIYEERERIEQNSGEYFEHLEESLIECGLTVVNVTSVVLWLQGRPKSDTYMYRNDKWEVIF